MQKGLRMWMALSATAVLFGFAGCAQQEIAKPSSNGASAVLIATELPCPALQKCSLTGVYFARLSDASDLKSGKLMPSDYEVRGFGFPSPLVRYYGLNLEPGVYIPVATRFVQETVALGITRTHFHTLLIPREMMEKAKVEIKAGQLGFMGRFMISGAMTSTRDPGKGDEVQQHYATVVQDLDKAAGVKGAGLLPDDFVFYVVKLEGAEQGADARKTFSDFARKDLESAGWKAQVDALVFAGGGN